MERTCRGYQCSNVWAVDVVGRGARLSSSLMVQDIHKRRLDKRVVDGVELGKLESAEMGNYERKDEMMDYDGTSTSTRIEGPGADEAPRTAKSESTKKRDESAAEHATIGRNKQIHQ